MIALLAPPWSLLPTDGLASGNDHLIQDVSAALVGVSEVAIFCREDAPPRCETEGPYRRLRLQGTGLGRFNDLDALDAYAREAVTQASQLGVRLMVVLQPTGLVEAVQSHRPPFACALVVSSHHLYRDDNYFSYGSLSSSDAGRVLDAADAVIALSGFLAERIVSEHAGARSKVLVIPQGVNAAFFTPRVARSDGPRLLYVGRLDRAKGLHILLEAFGKIADRHPNASLSIAGDYFGPEQATYRAEIASVLHRAPERVRFLGWVARGALPALYSSADVFVHPAVWDEPFASTVLEAMASGLPVVATRTGGTPEAVRHGESGLLVPPDDVEALAHALDQVASDAQLAAELGHAAQRTAAQTYTWGRFVDSLVALASEHPRQR